MPAVTAQQNSAAGINTSLTTARCQARWRQGRGSTSLQPAGQAAGGSDGHLRFSGAADLDLVAVSWAKDTGLNGYGASYVCLARELCADLVTLNNTLDGAGDWQTIDNKQEKTAKVRTGFRSLRQSQYQELFSDQRERQKMPWFQRGLLAWLVTATPR